MKKPDGKVVHIDERRRGTPEYIARQLEELAAQVRAGDVTGVAVATIGKSGTLSCRWQLTPEASLYTMIASVQYLATRINVITFLGEHEPSD